MIQIKLEVNNEKLTLREAICEFEKLLIEEISKKIFANKAMAGYTLENYIKAGSDGYVFECEILPKGTSRKLFLADELMGMTEAMLNDFKSK